MKKLNSVESFCMSEAGKAISINTHTGKQFIVRKDKFEKWADDREKRIVKGNLVDWQTYYRFYAEYDLADYITIRQGSLVFDGSLGSIRTFIN